MKVERTEEVGAFIKRLDPKARAKVRRRIALLGQYGHLLRMPYSRYVTQGIFELRTVGQDNIRLVYAFRDDSAVIFHAFVKKTENISTSEMRTIQRRFADLHL